MRYVFRLFWIPDDWDFKVCGNHLFGYSLCRQDCRWVANFSAIDLMPISGTATHWLSCLRLSLFVTFCAGGEGEIGRVRRDRCENRCRWLDAATSMQHQHRISQNCPCHILIIWQSCYDYQWSEIWSINNTVVASAFLFSMSTLLLHFRFLTVLTFDQVHAHVR